MPARDFYVPLDTPPLGGIAFDEREKFANGGRGAMREKNFIRVV